MKWMILFARDFRKGGLLIKVRECCCRMYELMLKRIEAIEEAIEEDELATMNAQLSNLHTSAHTVSNASSRDFIRGSLWRKSPVRFREKKKLQQLALPIFTYFWRNWSQNIIGLMWQICAVLPSGLTVAFL